MEVPDAAVANGNRQYLPPRHTYRSKRFDIDDQPSYNVTMIAITVSSKYQIVIPREVREVLQITPGTRLLVSHDKDSLHMVKEPGLKEIRGLLKGLKVKDAEIRDETNRQLP